MKKLYTLLLAASVAVSASAVVNTTLANKVQLKFNDRMIENSRISTLAAPAKIETAAAATDAPASLEGMTFRITYDTPEYNEDYTEITGYTALDNLLTFENPEVSEDGIMYDMVGLFEGVFNSSVTVLPIVVNYYPEDGQLELIPGTDLLSVGSTAYQFWTLLENDRLSSGLPIIYAWEDGAFKWIPSYNSGTQVVTTTGIGAGRQTTQGVSTAFEAVHLGDITPLEGAQGVMTTTVYGKNNQTNEAMEFESTDNVLASATETTLSISNWFGLGMDVTFDLAIDKTAKTLTLDKSQTFPTVVSGMNFNAYVAPADNDRDNQNVTIGTGNLVCTYAVANGATTITVPDWNVFVPYNGSAVSLYYPLYNTTIALPFDIDNEQGGVNDIVVDNNENAPVEYFNLQGMRVSEPAAGQVVIRRQGTKVEKLFVK